MSGGGQTTPTVLAGILRSTRVELEARKRDRPLEQLVEASWAARAGKPAQPRLRRALARPGIGVIAEFKRASPSAGSFVTGSSRPGGRRGADRADVRPVAAAYERGGASAMSVLTEGPNFKGSLADLSAAGAACGLPILRKDFVVDEYQLHEAVVAGAEAVLLIVAALEPNLLAALHESARDLGLDVLVEVHDSHELSIATSIGADLIGVNNRDLRDFSVDVQRTSQLLAGMPAGAVVVSESGISSPEQLRRLHREGVEAVLVGESLMRAPDPELALRELLGAG